MSRLSTPRLLFPRPPDFYHSLTMRPIPSFILSILLMAISGLCGYQWWRETELRRLAETQRDELLRHEAKDVEQETRIKAADAEILRLTGTLSELRSTSVSKEEFEELKAAAESHVASINKQNAIILQQNEAIQKQNEIVEQLNASVVKANDTIKSLVEQRDQLAQRLNDLTQRYNKLANPNGASESSTSANNTAAAPSN